jgi:hypothetical protein
VWLFNFSFLLLFRGQCGASNFTVSDTPRPGLLSKTQGHKAGRGREERFEFIHLPTSFSFTSVLSALHFLQSVPFRRCPRSLNSFLVARPCPLSRSWNQEPGTRDPDTCLRFIIVILQNNNQQPTHSRLFYRPALFFDSTPSTLPIPSFCLACSFSPSPLFAPSVISCLCLQGPVAPA